MDELTLEKTIGSLESVLHQQIKLHEQLYTLMNQKREAMRRGDNPGMHELCDLENEKVQAISELEKQRLQLVADLTLHVQPDAAAPMRMLELADALAEPTRGRLLVLRQQLLERMEQVREQSSIARRAAQSLVNHMQGILQTLGALSTGAGTYGQRGAPTVGGQVSTINVTA